MSTFSSVMTAVIVFMFFLYFCARLGESEAASHCLRTLFGKFAQRPLAEKLFILAFVVMMVAHGGSKSTNSVPLGGGFAAAGGNAPGDFLEAGAGGFGMLSGLDPEPPRLTTNQCLAGFALVRVATNAAPWLSVPSNAVTHEPWSRHGVAEDTFWLPACAAVPGDAAGRPAAGWAFTLGTNAVEGAHVSSSGTLSFGTPKGSPRAAALPDGTGIDFLAPLQGSIGTAPPEGRFWHAPTASNSVLLTWEHVFAGRDPGSPVTFQAELFWNGDFIYRYAFTNAPALTNFVVGAQHNGGGETYAFNDTNKLANGLELRWRAFGLLDPGVDDHDGDWLSTYDEVMLYGTNPALKDSDFDGLEDAAELAAGTDPLDPDTDGDGLADGTDPRPAVWDDPDGDAGGDGLGYLFEVTHGLDPAADNALDSDGDGWPDWKELMAGTATNDMSSVPVNTDGPQLIQVPALFEATVTLNADLPCPVVLNVGGYTLILQKAGSWTLTLKEGVAYGVTLTAPRPCAASLSCSLSSAFAAFQDPGGVFTGGASVPGGVPVACGVIAQPVLEILPAAVCFHSEDPKTVAAKVTPAMAGSYQWYWYGGPISANGGKSANISWGGGAGSVSVTFTASGAAQPRCSEREVTKCSRVDDDTWCDGHSCEHWYCACDEAGAGGDDDCGFHGQKVSKCREAVCPTHHCPYSECPEDWCHEHDCLYTECSDLHYDPNDHGDDPSGSGGGGGPGSDDPPETPPETPPDGDMETEGWILLNDDDDNADGSDDRYDEYPEADHDLRPVWPLGSFAGACCPCPAHRGADGWRARLDSCSDGLRVFRGSDKTGPVSVGDLFYPGERVYVEGCAASSAVSSESLHWELKNPGDVNAGTYGLANRFSALSLRLTGDYTLDGAVDDDDRAAEPDLSETYGWGIPAATNVFRLVRLSTQSHLGGVYTLSLEGAAGAIKIWATGSPCPGDSPLLACGQTVTDGVNGADFAGYPGRDVYVEAVSNGTATLTYAYAGTGEAAGISCSASLKMTAWELEIRSVELETNGMPVVSGGKVVPGERIPAEDSLSTYVPFDGGGAPAMTSTSPRWVTFAAVTNAFTNSATLSMTQEYAEGFKVWDMAFEGVTTNGTFAYLWQGESNAFLRAEYPTNAVDATMPLTVSMLDADFEGLTNEVGESFSLYRHDETNGFWGSTYSINDPREEIGMPAFSANNAFVVRVPPDAAFAEGTELVCRLLPDGEEGGAVEAEMERQSDGSYVTSLIVPVLDIDGDASLESVTNAVKLDIKSDTAQTVKMEIYKLGQSAQMIAEKYVPVKQAALFSGLVTREQSNDNSGETRARQAVSVAGTAMKDSLGYGVTPLFSPTKEQINEMLPRHSVWIHSGHGSVEDGILILRPDAANKYRGAWFKASDIQRGDLQYDLVFMNTCVSADQVFNPVGNANDPRTPPISWDEEVVDTHSVMAIGDRLNAKNQIGWRCSVNRMISMYIPGMLVAKLDTRFDGTKNVAQAVDAIKTELRVNRDKDFWWYAPQLTVLRSDGQKFDLKKRYGN